MPITIFPNDYTKIISQNSLPTVIEFYATWCPKCMMMESVYQRVSVQLKGLMTFYKMDVDEANTLATELGIEIFPTFIVYHKGKILGYTSGVLSEKILSERLRELASPIKKR